MVRLPASGATTASPRRNEAELHRVLSDLHVGHAFDATAVHELYGTFGPVIGRWLLEQQRLQFSPIAKALLSMARNLSEVSLLLNGIETGFHSDLEIAVASRAAQYLALDPRLVLSQRRSISAWCQRFSSFGFGKQITRGTSGSRSHMHDFVCGVSERKVSASFPRLARRRQDGSPVCLK
jgi:hypothetical protein